MTPQPDRLSAEERFRGVFAHFGAVVAYARRRGSKDADALAAEVMTVAWRRLADVRATIRPVALRDGSQPRLRRGAPLGAIGGERRPPC